MSDLDLDGEILAEEDAEPREATGPVRALPVTREKGALPVLKAEATTAVLAAAGGVLVGAATVAAVRAVTASSPRARPRRRLLGRRDTRANVVASRSFLVDVHLLGR